MTAGVSGGEVGVSGSKQQVRDEMAVVAGAE